MRSAEGGGDPRRSARRRSSTEAAHAGAPCRAAGSGPSSRTARSCSRITGCSRSTGACSPGCIPEIEMARFLVERAGFANTPPLLGDRSSSISTAATGERRTATRSACCSALSAIRATAGRMALELSDALSRRRAERGRSGAAPPDHAPICPTPIVFFLALARQLGLRTGEMHRALAELGGDDPAFAPEPITPDDIAAVAARAARKRPSDMLARLRARAATGCRIRRAISPISVIARARRGWTRRSAR